MVVRPPRALLLTLLALAALACGDKDTGDDSCDSPSLFYADTDGDGYGVDDDTVEDCAAPAGYAEQGGDCDDTVATIKPGAAEICDELDNDCDGTVDVDPTDGGTWYADADGDGYGDPDGSASLCQAASGYVDNARDCDDQDAEINPDGEEICDELDNDCDTLIDGDDSDIEVLTWYRDQDGDGYGDSGSDQQAACPGDGYVEQGGDCDDDDASRNPGAEEIWYDDVDQNCDGANDFDQDGDRYKAEEYEGSDCDDTDATVHPDAEDSWYDGVDSDCDGASDYDQDGDGYEHDAYGGDDCDDEDSGVHPDLPDDDGDGTDDDCNGSVDDDISLPDADAVLQGESSNDQAGEVLSGAGDVNGDGNDDFIVGVPSHSSSAGSAYLFLGPVSAEDSLDDGAVIIDGGSSGELLGTAVLLAGDLDGDGYDDYLAGAPYAGTLTDTAGDAYLFMGSADPAVGGDLSSSDADAIYTGVGMGNQAGNTLAGPGDLTGDGHDDLLIAAPGATVQRGVVYLISDASSGLQSLESAAHSWTGEDAGDYAGLALAGAGDVNGDGTPDILVGSYINDRSGTEAGSAYLVHGPGTDIDEIEDGAAIITGISSGDRSSWALDGAGDTNDDGYDDLLIGAYMRDGDETDGGAAYLLLGPVSGEIGLASADATIEGENNAAHLGYSVAGAGDLDGDGHDDLLLGTPGDNAHGNNTGSVYVLLGPVSGAIDAADADLKALGESASYQAGGSVAVAGDTDADGSLDLLLGATRAASGYGEIYLLLGPLF